MKFKNGNLIFLYGIIFIEFSFLVEKIKSINITGRSQESCDATLCSPLGGNCDNKNECSCNKCYISLIMPNDHRKCNYSQYSSFKAGLIELLFPIGFGHLYLGNIKNGLIKMVLTYFLVCGVYAIVIYIFLNIRRPDNYNYNSNTDGLLFKNVNDDVIRIKQIALLSQFLYIIIHVFDLYYLFLGKYKDGNNILLC